MALIMVGEPYKAESIGDDKGIDLIGLLFIRINPFEIADKLGIKLIDRGFKGSQSFA
jgi:hypothetical protein